MEKHFSWFDLVPSKTAVTLFSSTSATVGATWSKAAIASRKPLRFFQHHGWSSFSHHCGAGCSQWFEQSASSRRNPSIRSDSKMGVRNIMEMLIEGLLNQFEGVLGDRKLAIRFLPLMGTLFIFILCCNLLGVLPGFLPPTTDTSTNWAMAFMVFVVFNVAGFRANGMGYLAHDGPDVGNRPPYFRAGVDRVLFRPFSLQLRLMANRMAIIWFLEFFPR